MIQSKREILDGKKNLEWVDNLNKAVKDLNNTSTKMIGMKPKDAVQLDYVKQLENKFSENDVSMHHTVGDQVRRILRKDEYLKLSSDTTSIEYRRRATDPLWSFRLYEIVDV